MILEQLMEKKDLLIYIDLRIQQLKEIQTETVDQIEKKKKAILRSRFNGKISELCNFRNLIISSQLKEKSKRLWKKYGKQSGIVQFPKTKKTDTLDALESIIPILAKGGIITDPELQKIEKMELEHQLQFYKLIKKNEPTKE